VRSLRRNTRLPLLPLVFLWSPASTSFVRTSRSHHPIFSILIQFSLTAQTWTEYGTQWKEYYNAKVAGQPIQTSGPTLPPLPTTEATGEEWAAWGKAVGDAWTAYATSKGIDLAKVLEGLKYPEEPTDDNWPAYAAQWGQYGKQVQERFTAALAAKSP